MQDKSKQSHSSTNFYLVVAVLISAIGVSIGYAVHKHYVLQDMIQKNHIGDSWVLRFLEASKTMLAPVERFMEPFRPVIKFLFTLVIIEVAVGFIPKFIRTPISTKKEAVLTRIEKWIERKIAARLKSWYKKIKETINPFKHWS